MRPPGMPVQGDEPTGSVAAYSAGISDIYGIRRRPVESLAGRALSPELAMQNTNVIAASALQMEPLVWSIYPKPQCSSGARRIFGNVPWGMGAWQRCQRARAAGKTDVGCFTDTIDCRTCVWSTQKWCACSKTLGCSSFALTYCSRGHAK